MRMSRQSVFVVDITKNDVAERIKEIAATAGINLEDLVKKP